MTAEGRVVGGALMVVGIGVMGMVTAALAYRFIATPDSKTLPLDARLERIETSLENVAALLRDQGR